jgi:hypothetical protein
MEIPRDPLHKFLFRGNLPSGAEARVDLISFTARLKPRPFKMPTRAAFP